MLNYGYWIVLVERGSSAVECRIRNRESPCSNPLCYRFTTWAFSFSPRHVSSLICINKYLRRWWKSGWIIFTLNCCVARMLPREVELVPEWTDLPGEKCKVLWAVQLTGYCAMGPFKCYVTQWGVGGVRFPKKMRYEGVPFNVTRGWVGSNSQEKTLRNTWMAPIYKKHGLY